MRCHGYVTARYRDANEREGVKMLELKDVSVTFKKNRVLNAVTETFYPGDVVGLVAPNGTGKSTLLNVLMNHVPSDEGEVVLKGNMRYRRPKDKVAIHQVMSMMPDQADLYDDMSGFEHLKMYQRLWNNRQIDLVELVEALNMGHYVKKKVGTYSLGMRQRLCFAMQIGIDTEVMLMDEVMNGLDPDNVTLISEMIQQKQQEGKIIIIASHLLENLEEYASKIYFLVDGKLSLFVDKQKGYENDVPFIKVAHPSENLAKELAKCGEMIWLTPTRLLLSGSDREVTKALITDFFLKEQRSFSYGILSLSDAYQLIFKKN